MPLPLAIGRRASSVALVVAVAACAGTVTPSPSPGPSSSPDVSAAPSTAPQWIPGLAELPPEARAGTGGAAPRPAAYWAVWNSCAIDNRAAEAAANGGRAAGFILVDDLLAQPGVGLGDHRLGDCDEALRVLQAGEAAPVQSIERLAAEVLVAELNLDVGSESCPAAEEAVIGGQHVLAIAGYRGPDQPVAVPSGEAGEALATLLSLLDAYGSGALCE